MSQIQSKSTRKLKSINYQERRKTKRPTVTGSEARCDRVGGHTEEGQNGTFCGRSALGFPSFWAGFLGRSGSGGQGDFGLGTYVLGQFWLEFRC